MNPSRFIQTRKCSKRSEKYLSEYLHHPENGLVSDRVAHALKDFCTAHEIGEALPLDGLKKLSGDRSTHFDLKPFHLQKFPDTQVLEVHGLLHNLCQRFGYSKVSMVDEIEDGLFLLSPST